MNSIPNTNLLETVQFISIFSYLNALSDFLFIENYLPEIYQNKQIPVVNALYEYLEDHHDNQTMMLKLIRRLLKGSDLYGEEENENPDVTFVNTMFDYIIKSLVFDKYGNIYGFLADVVRKARTLEIYSLYKEIKANLESAAFDNEYGERSVLSSLAANRIFADIIIPLFPQTKTDLNLLSLDYIYAQAGLHFLRPGIINNTYYTDSENFYTTVLDQENLFDEYLTVGLTLNYNLSNDNLNLATLPAFALPALFHYVSKEPLEKENITSIVSDPYYWKAAYDNLFPYLHMTFNEIEKTLKSDTKYQIHKAFSNFHTHSAIDELYLDQYCERLNKEEKTSKIPTDDQLHHSINYRCREDYLLPNLTAQFMTYVNAVSAAYKKHDMKSIKQSFGKSFLKSLKYDKVIIQLLAPNDNILFDKFSNITRIPYDLFVFYYPDARTADFYALLRENYNTTLIKLADDPDEFKNKTGLTVETLLKHGFHRMNLKLVNQSMDVFWENFLSYKTMRLESYLKCVDQNLQLGDWWREFGLSMVPLYSCLAESTHNRRKASMENFFQIDGYTFFNLLDKNISLFLTQKSTRSLLASVGASFKTIGLKNLIYEELNTTEMVNKRIILSPLKEPSVSKIFEIFSLHIEEPGFQLASVPKDYLEIILAITDDLHFKISRSFKNVKNIVDNIRFLNTSASITIMFTDKNKNCYFDVQNQITATGHGYGYKYVPFSQSLILQLRTDYDNKTKVLFLFNDNLSNDSEEHVIGEITKFKYKHQNCTFGVTNHLSNSEEAIFLEVSINSYNKKCDIEIYEKRPIPLVECPRYARVVEQKRYLNQAIKLVLEENANVTETQILKTMENYTFPDEDRIDLRFLHDLTNTEHLKVPEWAEHYKIDNHALLLSLRNEFQLDVRNLSSHDGALRIDSIYAFRERQKIEGRTTLETIVQNFNDQEARYVTTFEDYYAIRNFATTGYTRITGSTIEANQMKIALYKLAIRQSDDPDDEFDQTLFRIEAKPVEVFSKLLLSRKLHILQKFSKTHLKEILAINSTAVAMPGYINILYEMKFTKPYFRAKIRQLYHWDESVTILLPGTTFSIANVQEIRLDKLGDCFKVELVHDENHQDKYIGYKNIMKEITRIMSEN